MIKKKQKFFGTSHPETVSALVNMISALAVVGRYEEALANIEKMSELLDNDSKDRENELVMLKRMEMKIRQKINNKI